MELLEFKKDSPEAFSWGVELVKESGDKYGINTFVDQMDIWESLFAKAMQLQLMITDGAGLFESAAIQAGDSVNVSLLKTDDLDKVVKTFRIISVLAGGNKKNTQGRSYTILATTESAVLNKIGTVNKAFKGKVSAVVTEICKTWLKLDPKVTDVEESEGDKTTILLPNKTPYSAIDWCALHGISAEYGETNSFYLFYENADGFKFWTIPKIIKEATTFDYYLQGDNSKADDERGGDSDLYRILTHKQNVLGSATSALDSGAHQSETLEFNILERRMTSKKFDFSKESATVLNLGTKPIVDLKLNFDQFRQDAGDTKSKGDMSKLKVRGAEESYGELNTYGKKHASMMAQKNMFNQLSFSMTCIGNTQLRAGDLINIIAKANSAETEREEDRMFSGKFLIGNLRHHVTGDKYKTAIDLFKDGLDVERTPL